MLDISLGGALLAAEAALPIGATAELRTGLGPSSLSILRYFDWLACPTGGTCTGKPEYTRNRRGRQIVDLRTGGLRREGLAEPASPAGVASEKDGTAV